MLSGEMVQGVLALYFYFNLHLEQFLKSSGLSLQELVLLYSLFYRNGASQEMLCQISHLDKAAVSRSLKTLEEKKLIERSRNDLDQRKKNIFLTPAAYTKKKSVDNTLGSWVERVLLPSNEEEHALWMRSIIEISYRASLSQTS